MGAGAGTEELQTSPPIQFPLYGLDADRPGVRWLDGYGDALGDDVRWIGLAQGDPGADELIMVETFSRSLTNSLHVRGGEPPLKSVSFAAAVTLVNLTLPDPSVDRPEGLFKAVVDHADTRSRQHADWTPVTWLVDGAPVTALAWEFAGGWAAFSDALPDVYLAISGSTGSPDGIAIDLLKDSRAYHFDLDQPLHPRVIETSAAAALADCGRSWPGRADLHPDQLRLLPSQT
jgi:hypothetical protein